MTVNKLQVETPTQQTVARPTNDLTRSHGENANTHNRVKSDLLPGFQGASLLFFARSLRRSLVTAYMGACSSAG